MPWTNNDGLVIRFAQEKIVKNQGGEPPAAGETRDIVTRINIANLTTTPTLVVGYDGIVFPRNSRIEEVEVVNESAAATITSINFGLKRLDRTTELDHDGILAAYALANYDAAGEKNVLRVGSSGAGALVGTTLAFPGVPVAYIAGSVGTGIIKIRTRITVIGKDVNPTNF